jgi:hypothetical protein
LAEALEAPVRVGPTEIPVWGVLGVAAAVVVAATMATALLVRCEWSMPAGAGESSPRASGSSSAGPVASASGSVDDLEGLRAHVAQRESLPVGQRSLEDWVVLARANAILHRHEEAAMAYRNVLSLRKAFHDDPVLLSDLLEAGLDPAASDKIINLCASPELLKPRENRRTGPELLWQLRERANATPGARNIADAALQKLLISSANATPELRTAVELETVETCKQAADAVSRAARHADQRSTAALTRLEARAACEGAGCLPCLRGSAELARALEVSRTRLPPSLGSDGRSRIAEIFAEETNR